ncbi:polysaccharide deacetylase family protein [Gemmatimonas sp.]|uniref:polysaccharide deacetylase family protein n=1 Tax=Gemmatimonas sp. TaxID=1962908 RepID=UPI00286E4DD2|nr:polysaccharide deacetylase family protein [Gemmatimonas sp.]
MTGAAVPILTYHSLDDSGSVISTSPGVFRAQMELIARRGYRVIALRELLDAWDRAETVAPNTVVLTFDDATENLLPHALPVLSALQFRATIFAVSGKLGGVNDWPDQAPGIPRVPLLSRSGLAECIAAGCEIGAHSATHARLDTMSPAAWSAEVAGCREALESTLGASVTSFAYPFGHSNAALRAMVAQHYRAAVGTQLRVAAPTDERYELPRVEMYYWRSPSVFPLFGHRAGDWYLRARAAARAVRASWSR